MVGFMGRGGGSFHRQSFAPVKVGEELDVRIEAVGEKGDGMCRKKGFVIFVPDTKEGDEVRIKVTRVLRKVGFGEVLGPAQGPVEGSDEQGYAKKEEPAPAVEDSEDFGEDEQPADGSSYSDEQSYEDSEDFGEDEQPAADVAEKTADESAVEEEAPAEVADESAVEEEAPAEEEQPEEEKKEE
jgi:predicted RNA-binding protein with TRAM domain